MKYVRSRRTNWTITTAAATAFAMVAFGSAAFAQYRVGSDGRANDANNRIGSGGINQPGQANPNGVTGNQIVTGNVTGGREFRGNVPYTDPFAFRGRVAGIGVDNFTKQSSGVPTGGAGPLSNFNANSVKPFYGDARTAEVPPGFVQQPNSQGYVPAPQVTRQAGDFRMGAALPLDSGQVMLPQPGQLILPGPVDSSTQIPTVITASPLYGVRQWSTGNDNDLGFLQGLNEASRLRLDNATIDRMRQELEQSAQGPEGQDQKTGDQSNGANDASRIYSPSLSPMESPNNNPLNSGMQSQNTGGSPLGAPLQNNTGTRQRLLTAPAQQSTQIAELQRRLKQYESQLPGAENIEANREYQKQLRDKQEKEAKANAGKSGVPGMENKGPQTPGAPGMPGAPGANAPATPGAAGQPQAGADKSAADKIDEIVPDYGKRSKEVLEGKDKDKNKSAQPKTSIPGSMRPQLPKEKPLMISSLAQGVQAKNLKDFLTEAESLMKQGKFYSALDQYETAEMIAPNNPMITLGRANAELGASYYVRAEKDLRDAFMKDPSLLMAQYDLKTFLGNDRLDFLVKDLKEVASTEKTEPRPVFLLAYIMYNTGNERLAASWLDLAEKRAGKSDPFYQMLRKYWVLPTEEPAGTDQNK